MRNPAIFGISMTALLLTIGLPAGAQQAAAPPPAAQAPPKTQTRQPAPDAPVPAANSDEDDNAFPTAQSEAAQKKAQEQANQQTDNAFPEAKSEAAEKAAQGDSNSGTSSAPAPNGNEPYSSSATRTRGLDLLGNDDSRIDDGAGHIVNNPALAKEDLRVGKFYMDQYNYPGAYMRFKEATEVAPGNAEAVYLLAQAARKTSHLDEAERNFQVYLDAEPKGKYAKDARKALQELAGK